jgi:hypothetical protein
MRHRDHRVRLEAVVDAGGAQRLDLVLRPERAARLDVELPERDPGGTRGEREQVLAVRERRVHLLQPLRVLPRLRQQVRVVHRGDERQSQHAERDEADGAREPVVVERGAAETVRAHREPGRGHRRVVHAADRETHDDRGTAARERERA